LRYTDGSIGPKFAAPSLSATDLLATNTSIDPRQIALSPLRHRDLVVQLTMRDVIGRYRGSVMGIVWSLANPILMLAVYTFVFSVVFGARWGNAGGSGPESRVLFALNAFAGLIVQTLFAECVNRAPALMLAHTNFVKKIVFPLDILPWMVMGSALFHALVSMAVLLGGFLLTQHYLPWTLLLLPLSLVPLILFTMGCAWFLASLGVYFRDVVYTTTLLTTVVMFLSPVFYPITSVPERFRTVLYLNPLTWFVEETRGLLIGGVVPSTQVLLLTWAGALLTAWLGFAWFQKTRRGFADVL
jgi:homopolymeric O-antigen transport system permease protein